MSVCFSEFLKNFSEVENYRRPIGLGLLSGIALALLPAPAFSQLEVAEGGPGPQVVHADVVALDQLLVYNRFGSFNPFGMIFALRRDVSLRTDGDRRPDADFCGGLFGTEQGVGDLRPGQVRLKDCKRPRPLVLRVNAGDVLEVTFTNLLRADQPGISTAYAGDTADPDPALARAAQPGKGFCQELGSGTPVAPHRPDIKTAFNTPAWGERQCREAEAGEADGEAKPPAALQRRPEAPATGTDWPRTRLLSFVIPGLEPLPVPKSGEKPVIHPACTGLSAIAPGQSVTCRWQAEREGTHLFSSFAAPSGGEGDAGSLGHGLFGALIVEPAKSRHFRSQITQAAYDWMWKGAGGDVPHARANLLDFDAAREDQASVGPQVDGQVDRSEEEDKPFIAAPFACAGSNSMPVLELSRACGVGPDGEQVRELVHGDLNAIIVPDGTAAESVSKEEKKRAEWRVAEEAKTPFREFTTIFHDELKTFYADEFKQLDRFGQLSGVRDGFAVNYGASGVGSAMIANRLGIGPAAGCAECLYEEFFLESWANGDPALLEAFPDDPSNVHHSYLNDKVVFRNFHAGKETHVFHLHAHQWFAGNDAGRGAYLDSQTIGPQQGFTYRVYQGGLDRFKGGTQAPQGWWNALGAGNRNRTPGDAIFHCHLYPHFAQGMWELWRIHDVLEDGSRVLPDGQKTPGLSVGVNKRVAEHREGSVGFAGEWLAPLGGSKAKRGTPVPGVVPLPGFALPPLPTYTEKEKAKSYYEARKADAATLLVTDALPGFPFYIPGKAGRRAPQPPLDMAPAAAADAGPQGDNEGRKFLDGGLPRHVVVQGKALPTVLKPLRQDPALLDELVEKRGVLPLMLAHGDMTSSFETLSLELLPQRGTALERNAMAFHSLGDESINVVDALGKPVPAKHDLDPKRIFGPAAGAPQPGKTRLDPATGAYPSPLLPRKAAQHRASEGDKTLQAEGRFAVNGALPAPGAPFADPCGAPMVFALPGGPSHRVYDAYNSAWKSEEKRFASSTDNVFYPGHPVDEIRQARLVADPALLGYRRFDVSAVELTLVVNRAGWHDPQGRINVLSSQAAKYKNKTRWDAEPFFFRAFSGECISFHHTNETPKKLKLDDFQMAVPTDTIGQHIHLVKFDVTSSDGSGNGFNYEDGTFAPDEILERICKSVSADKRQGEKADTIDTLADRRAECTALENSAPGSESVRKEDGVPASESMWKEDRASKPKYFQTTVQRWFADPILSYTGDDATSPDTNVADRTLRTVFTHDHFGPSNIQQHGFYSALLIEPAQHAVCITREASASPAQDPDPACVEGPAARVHPANPEPLKTDAEKLVGARADVFVVKGDVRPGEPAMPAIKALIGDLIHPDAREYAIAIADFALLYDGRTQSSPTRADGETSNGLDRLLYEAEKAAAGSAADRHVEDEEAESAPARVLRDRGFGALATKAGYTALQDRWLELRTQNGNPVAPPPRPEAISQKHHDPYLVNYRNEPVPLRVGTDAGHARPSFLAKPCRYASSNGSPPQIGYDSIVRQRSDQGGDLANLFRSAVHGDPCTPVIEALSNDRVVVRLIQGAQEVQHTFVVEGRTLRRNADQPFPAERPKGPELAATHSRAAACAQFGNTGRAREFAGWALTARGDPYWDRIRALAAGCDNILGYVPAQEIGISEHFEVGATFSAQSGEYAPRYEPKSTSASIDTPQNLPTLDYLYHFGSTDALWNGAWGLVRSYGNEFMPDISACLGQAGDKAAFDRCMNGPAGTGATALIGKRLRPFAQRRETLQKTDNTTATAASGPAVAGDFIRPADDSPIAWCPAVAAGDVPGNVAKMVEVAVVAVRARDVLSDQGDWPGTRYRTGLADRDGLLLVPVDKAALGLKAAFEELFLVKPLTLEMTKAEVRKLVRQTLAARNDHDGTPFVLRVNAGDCIDLLLVNALPAFEDVGDVAGDALMPRITPLNVDPDERQYHGTKPFGANPWEGKTRPQVLPSRSIALSLPLPVPMLNPLGTLPVGSNDSSALAPAGDASRTPAIARRYYAGFTWIDREALWDFVKEPVAGFFPGSDVNVEGMSESGGCAAERQIVVLGTYFCLKNATATDELRKKVDVAVAQMLAGKAGNSGQAVITAIPYAFGTLPIRPVGDLISHGAHGLAGTLVVEPQGAVVAHATDLEKRHAAAALVTVPAVELVAAGESGATLPGTTFSEQVLMWQDGLNLRRNLRWPQGYGLRGQVKDLGVPGRPVPDCIVCDDSYDLGEHGVSYRAAPFAMRLMDMAKERLPWDFGVHTYPRDTDDLNRRLFPAKFFAERPLTPTINAAPDQEIAVRIAAPVARARQRAFVSAAAGYDDLFPGFGSGHSALIGPGKAFTAWSCAPRTAGTYLWRDGPQPLFAAGAWGHLSVSGEAPARRTYTCRAGQ